MCTPAVQVQSPVLYRRRSQLFRRPAHADASTNNLRPDAGPGAVAQHRLGLGLTQKNVPSCLLLYPLSWQYIIFSPPRGKNVTVVCFFPSKDNKKWHYAPWFTYLRSFLLQLVKEHPDFCHGKGRHVFSPPDKLTHFTARTIVSHLLP